MLLTFLSGPHEGDTCEVRSDCTMGRDASNTLVLEDVASSLVHCVFFVGENRAFVKDLGSTNGTFVNGLRVVHAELQEGDAITVGDSVIRAEMTDAVSGALPRVTIRADLGTIDEGLSLPVDDPLDDEDDEHDELVRAAGGIVADATYYLKRKIAAGGMGSVYEAEQLGAEGFCKVVALKIIRPEYVNTRSFVSSFIGEAKLVANLVHQNIVQIYQLGRFEHGYYIAMEYIDGIDLTHFLLRQRMMDMETPIEIATYIVSRICRGLEYAHSKHGASGQPLALVHRDVSPKNIMITNEGEVKVADFGVAKAALYMEEEHEDYLVGSPQYMSPEQAACETVDARSDLYSLGLILYELLTGTPAYPDEDEMLTLKKVRAGKIENHPALLRPDLPEPLCDILLKCLAADHTKRYATAGELGYDLEYQMYSKGYGPTIVTLARYVSKLFPERVFYAPPTASRGEEHGS